MNILKFCMPLTYQGKWDIKFKSRGRKLKVIVSHVPPHTLNWMEEQPFQSSFIAIADEGGIMEPVYFAFSLGGWLMRGSYQLNPIQGLSLLSQCMVFTWGHHFLDLATDEVSLLVNYTIPIYSLVFSHIESTVEVEWFLVPIEDF